MKLIPLPAELTPSDQQDRGLATALGQPRIHAGFWKAFENLNAPMLDAVEHLVTSAAGTKVEVSPGATAAARTGLLHA